MGQSYSHLNLKDRIIMFDVLKRGILSVAEVARILGRHRSTIYRELNRNYFKDEYPEVCGWFPITAHDKARKRRRKNVKLIRHKALRDYVVSRLRLNWSPEQIAGRLKLEGVAFPRISYEAIYQFVYSKTGRALQLYRWLYRHRKNRRRRGGRKPRGSHIPLYCNISERPKSLQDREDFGHWEADLIIFKREHGKQNLTSLIERKTRFQVLLPNADRKSSDVMARLAKRLRPLPSRGRQTITFDRGTEFMAWRQLHALTGIKSYFCDVSSPWQKGAVENSNGRVRRYLPLDTNLAETPPSRAKAVAEAMNATPRKCLAYKTPKEAFTEQLRQYL